MLCQGVLDKTVETSVEREKRTRGKSRPNGSGAGRRPDRGHREKAMLPKIPRRRTSRGHSGIPRLRGTVRR
jgi:hypothetical protein